MLFLAYTLKHYPRFGNPHILYSATYQRMDAPSFLIKPSLYYVSADNHHLMTLFICIHINSYSYYFLLNYIIVLYLYVGPVRWYRLDPPDHIRQVPPGKATNFTIWIVARPLPDEDNWHWKFSPRNTTDMPLRKPSHVNLRVYDNMATLNIENVTAEHHGYYYIWTQNKYGGWGEEELRFTLTTTHTNDLDIRLKPYSVNIPELFADRIKVTLTFINEIRQRYIIQYTDLTTGAVREQIGTTSDGHVIIYDITDGIEPETKYQLLIYPVNGPPDVATDVIDVGTPGKYYPVLANILSPFLLRKCLCVCVFLAMYNKAQAQRISNREFKLWTFLQGTHPEWRLFLLRHV